MVSAGTFLKDEKKYYASNFIENPTVSVILPTYCRGDNGLLERAIRSVLDQSFTALELIVVDDGSIDGTQALLTRLLQEDSRILYIRNDVNSGLPALRLNQGLLYARGRYIAYQFDDDQWTPEAMDILVGELDKLDEPALVYGQWEVLDSRNGEKAVREQPFSYQTLLDGNFIANNSVLHHRELFELYGMYDCNLVMRRLCDWDLWLRWSQKVSFYYVDQLVSRVESYVVNSLGVSFCLNELDCRIWASHERDPLLKPDAFPNYAVDELLFFRDQAEKRKAYNRHVLQWQLRHDSFSPPQSPEIRKRLLVTKPIYSASVPVMVENFARTDSKEFEILFFHDRKLKYEYIRDNDILVLCRSAQNEVLQIVKRLKAERRPVTVIYILDDDMLHFYVRGQAFDYLAPGTPMYCMVEKLLSLSDYIVSCTESVNKFYKKYNPFGQAMSLTNIPSRYLNISRPYDEDDTFRIAFMGGSFREQEFSQISQDLVRLSDKYGNKISFEFWGYLPEAMKSITRTEIHYVGYTQSYYEYLNRLQSKQFNLFLAPLFVDQLSLGKSPIKLLESCVCSAIGVYSEHPVYECIQDGVTGYKIADGESWFDKIDAIIQAPIEEKKRIYKAAQELVYNEYTTEVRLPKFKRYIAMAEVARLLNKRLIAFALSGGIEDDAVKQLLFTAGFFQENGIPVCLLLPEDSPVCAGRPELEAQFQIERLSFQGNSDIETVHWDKLSASFSQKLEELKIGAVFSDGWIPEVKNNNSGSAVTHIVIPGGAPSSTILDEVHKGYGPDAVAVLSPADVAKWQDKFACRAEWLTSAENEQSAEQIIRLLLDVCRQGEAAVNWKPGAFNLSLPGNQRPAPRRKIESDCLVFSRSIHSHRSYVVFADQNEISQIGVIFACDNESFYGTISIDISFAGRLLRKITVTQDQLRLNDWTYITFAPMYGCGGRELQIDFNIAYQDARKCLGVYEDARKRSFIYRLGNKLHLPMKRKDVLYVDIK